MADVQIRVIEFKTTYIPGPDGMPTPVDWVEYAPVGKAQYTVIPEKVARILKAQPPSDPNDPNQSQGVAWAKRQYIEPLYNAWKRGEELPLDGTPLSAWTQLSAEQAKVLRASGIKTIEEFSSWPDGQLSAIRLPQVRDLQVLARRFLDSKEANKVTAALADKDRQLAELREQVKALSDALRADVAEEAQDAIPAPIKRRGRPPKVQVEEAA